MITDISLFNFRNFKNITLHNLKKINIIHGPNGCGKTNIIESIFLLKGGKGINKSEFNEILYSKDHRLNSNNENKINIKNKKFTLENIPEPELCNEFFVSFITNNLNAKQINIHCNCETKKHQISIEKKIVKKKSELLSLLKIISLTPDMDYIFTAQSSNRRSFFEHIVSSIIPKHSDNLSQYSHQIKSRLKILKSNDYLNNDSWLNAIETNIAEISIEIFINRYIIIFYINKVLSSILNTNNIENFPYFLRKIFIKIESKFDSFIEEKIQKYHGSNFDSIIEKLINNNENNTIELISQKTSQVIKKHQKINQEILSILKDNREKDKIIKQTTFGCHKSDFVTYSTDVDNNQYIKKKSYKESNENKFDLNADEFEENISNNNGENFQDRDNLYNISKKNNLSIHISKFSTGEQKMALIFIIASLSSVIYENDQNYEIETIKIMLLDDIFSHLDVERETFLINFLLKFRFQIWITTPTSDLDRFKNLTPDILNMINILEI